MTGQKFEIGRLDESCISDPKSEISSWTEGNEQSNSRFLISVLRCRIRPILQFLICIVILGPLYVLSHETLTTTVLFDREIVRVLDKHCVMCHVASGPAFPLST